MTKSILIISSEHTGHGHKSITEALCEKFSDRDDIKIHIVDGFSLGGRPLIKVGKSYGFITRKAESLWELIYDISETKPALINEIVEITIKENFLKLIRDTNPDLILSVHPNFNGSIINILEKNNIKIPVITFIADLVSISPLWADNRAEYTISPTFEAKLKCLEYGVSEDKIKVLGFPVRSKFCSNVENDFKYTIERPLECLIMSGGEGVGNMKKNAEILLDNFNCNVKIVAGRNIALKRKLELTLNKKYGDRVIIYGFTEKIHELMLTSDIAFTRGSPNVMMEAVACNVPLVITGSLPGQEQGNPRYAVRHNFGVECKNVKDIHSIITNLLANNAEKLNIIKCSQKEYFNQKAAENIADFIINANVTKKEYRDARGLVGNLLFK